jgi:glycosyltransferase involved in cell wall biosynthesis
MAEALQDAKIMAAPMFAGSGLQNKLLEAMSTGIPSVTTTLANNALGAIPNTEIMIADTPEEFAEKIILLLQNPELYHQISERGRQFVNRNFQWDILNSTLAEMMREARSTK